MRKKNYWWLILCITTEYRDSASSLSLSLQMAHLITMSNGIYFLSLRNMILSLNKRRSGLWQKRYNGSQSKGKTEVVTKIENRGRVGVIIWPF